MRKTRRLPWFGRYCARSLSRRVCWIEIWRRGPSGAKVTKSGWVANSSGSSLRLSAGQRSRPATVSRLGSRLRSSRSINSGWPTRRAPSRRARVALPTPSGPENKSVWTRRSCAIICSSAPAMCGLPQNCSNIGAHDIPDGTLDIVKGEAAIDPLDAVGLARGQSLVSLKHLAVEFHRLFVHAGFRCGPGGVTGVGAGQAGLDIDVDENREIRLETTAGHAVQCEDGFGAESAAAALISQAGIGEAIGYHDLTPGEGRQNQLIHVLRTGGEV